MLLHGYKWATNTFYDYMEGLRGSMHSIIITLKKKNSEKQQNQFILACQDQDVYDFIDLMHVPKI